MGQLGSQMGHHPLVTISMTIMANAGRLPDLGMSTIGPNHQICSIKLPGLPNNPIGSKAGKQSLMPDHAIDAQSLLERLLHETGLNNPGKLLTQDLPSLQRHLPGSASKNLHGLHRGDAFGGHQAPYAELLQKRSEEQTSELQSRGQ